MTTQNFTQEEEKKLIGMYFYLQDIMIDITSCYHSIHSISKFMNGEEYKFLVNDGKRVVFTNQSLNTESLGSGVRIPFHSLVISICKLCETISNPDLKALLARLDSSIEEKFSEFYNKFYTDSLKEYRNKYVAHPLNHPNKSKGEFLTFNELEVYVKKILNVQANLSIHAFCEYVDNFYSSNNMLSQNICNLIHKFAVKLETEFNKKLERKNL